MFGQLQARCKSNHAASRIEDQRAEQVLQKAPGRKHGRQDPVSRTSCKISPGKLLAFGRKLVTYQPPQRLAKIKLHCPKQQQLAKIYITVFQTRPHIRQLPQHPMEYGCGCWPWHVEQLNCTARTDQSLNSMQQIAVTNTEAGLPWTLWDAHNVRVCGIGKASPCWSNPGTCPATVSPHVLLPGAWSPSGARM